VWKVSETTKRVMTDQVRDLYADDLDDVAALSSSDHHVLAQPGRATGT
jgi:hypothetical protein